MQSVTPHTEVYAGGRFNSVPRRTTYGTFVGGMEEDAGGCDAAGPPPVATLIHSFVSFIHATRR
jgi:hypothetical protein